MIVCIGDRGFIAANFRILNFCNKKSMSAKVMRTYNLAGKKGTNLIIKVWISIYIYRVGESGKFICITATLKTKMFYCFEGS